LGEFNSDLNVFCLGAFVSTSKKNDQHHSSLLRIDPVARAMVDPQLRDSSSDGPDITRIAAEEALNPGLHERLCPEIP
jgi:hypothetical protein